jgi:hypothetical protein
VSLATLRKIDPDRLRPYRLGGAKILAPVGFAAANLIIYWGGFDTTWKIEVGLAVGLLIFLATRAFGSEKAPLDLRNSLWVWPWLIGGLVIGFLGRYDSSGAKDRASGKGELFALPAWWDLVVVIAFSMVIFYFATTLGKNKEHVDALVNRDEENLEEDPLLSS